MAIPRNQVNVGGFADPYGRLGKTFSDLSKQYSDKATREQTLALREKEAEENARRFGIEQSLRQDRFNADELARQTDRDRQAAVGGFYQGIAENIRTPEVVAAAEGLLKSSGVTDEQLQNPELRGRLLDAGIENLFQEEAIASLGRSFYRTENIGDTPLAVERLAPFVTGFDSLSSLKASQKANREEMFDINNQLSKTQIDAYKALQERRGGKGSANSLLAFDTATAAERFKGTDFGSGRLWDSHKETAKKQGDAVKAALISSGVDSRIGVAILNDMFSTGASGGDLDKFNEMSPEELESYIKDKESQFTSSGSAGSSISSTDRRALAGQIADIASGQAFARLANNSPRVDFEEARQQRITSLVDEILGRNRPVSSPAAGNIESRVLENLGISAPSIPSTPSVAPEVSVPAVQRLPEVANIPNEYESTIQALQRAPSMQDVVGKLDLSWPEAGTSRRGRRGRAPTKQEKLSKDFLEAYNDVLEANRAAIDFDPSGWGDSARRRIALSNRNNVTKANRRLDRIRETLLEK